MSKKSPIKEFFSQSLRVVLSVGLLWYIFSKIDFEKTIDVVKSAKISYLLAAFAVYCVIYVVLLARWWAFIRALDLKVSLKNVVRYFFIGLFGNLFLPSSIGGDFLKILGLCRETPDKAKVVASVLLDRLSGFAGIVLVAILAFCFGYKLIDDTTILISIVFLAGVSLTITALLFNKKAYAWGCQIFNKLPKFKESLMSLHRDITLLKENKIQGLIGIGYSCLAQLILAITFYLTARALNQDIGLIYFLVFVPLICVESSLPSIGGLGVREAGAAFLFAKIGVDSGVSVSISLINFVFMVVIGLLGGLVYVSTLSSRRVQHPASIAPSAQR